MSRIILTQRKHKKKKNSSCVRNTPKHSDLCKIVASSTDDPFSGSLRKKLLYHTPHIIHHRAFEVFATPCVSFL